MIFFDVVLLFICSLDATLCFSSSAPLSRANHSISLTQKAYIAYVDCVTPKTIATYMYNVLNISAPRPPALCTRQATSQNGPTTNSKYQQTASNHTVTNQPTDDMTQLVRRVTTRCITDSRCTPFQQRQHTPTVT